MIDNMTHLGKIVEKIISNKDENGPQKKKYFK